MREELSYSKMQTAVLLLLRLVIGYHFLFEGMNKLVTPNWSSAPFLLQSNWLFSNFFHFLASSEILLSIVDILNIWGQILIGLSLIIGLYSSLATLFGAVLIFSYYIAIPPFIDSYTFIDKNLFELFGLIVIVLFPTSNLFGLDYLMKKYRTQ